MIAFKQYNEQLDEGKLGKLTSSIILGLSLLSPIQFTYAQDKDNDVNKQQVQKKLKFKDLLNALIQVESNGNDKAIGDNGKAFGSLQMHKKAVEDVNGISKIYKLKDIDYIHDDAFNRDKAIRMAMIYLVHYGKLYKKDTGREPTLEIYSRIWNGGPKGYKKQATLKYWNKVKQQILKEK